MIRSITPRSVCSLGSKLLSLCLLCLSLSIPSTVSAQIYYEQLDQWRSIWNSPVGTISDSLRLHAGSELASEYAKKDPDSLLWISKDMEQMGYKRNSSLWLATAYQKRGKYYYLRGDTDSALHFYHKSLHTIDGKAVRLKFFVLGNLARQYATMHQVDSAMYYFQQAINYADTYGFEQYSHKVYANLGYMQEKQGDLLQAMNNYLKSAEIGETYGDTLRLNATYYHLGQIFQKFDLPKHARRYLAKANRIARAKGSPAGIINSHQALIPMANNLDEIGEYVQRSQMIADSTGLRHKLPAILTTAAQVYLDSLQPHQAEQLISRALDIAEEFQRRDEYMFAILLRAKTHYLTQRYQASIADCRAVQPYYAQNPDSTRLIVLYQLLGQNYEHQNQLDSALYYQKEWAAIVQHINSNQLTREVIQRYLAYQSEQKHKLLHLEKENAEQMASRALAKQRFSRITTLLVTIFSLLGISILWWLFMQKRMHAATLQQLNNALDQEKDKLKRKNTKLQQFAHIISHDILANLDLILSSGHVLVHTTTLPPSLKQYYTLTQKSACQLKNYCLNLLREAKDEPVQQTVPINPNPILHSTLECCQPALDQAGVQVQYGSLSPTFLPQGTLEQLFQNIISNVLRHAISMPYPTLSIHEHCDEHGQLYWTFSDNGPGIPDDQREAIFTHQKQAGNPEPGSQHIGLYMLRSALRAYGADIWVDSQYRDGASFIVRLPAYRCPANSQQLSSTADSFLQAAPHI